MAKNQNFIIELKLKANNNDLAILTKRFNIAEKMYNKTLKFAMIQIKRMKENKAYKRILKQYIEYKKIYDEEYKTKKVSEKTKSNLDLYSKLLTEIRYSFNLSEYQFHKFVKIQQNMYKKHIDSNTSQKIASTVWKAVSVVLFGNGEKLHYKKYGQLTSVEGKSNKAGIRYRNNMLMWNKLNIPVKIRKNDLFIHESLQRNIKFCRIVRKPFKNGYKYFIQLILEGLPPNKRINSTGAFRHAESPNKRVGIDLGTSTIAVCSENKVILEELAIKSKKYDNEILKLYRKLNRSMMANNPKNYNSDGTIIKGIKLKWIKPRSYMKTLFKLKNMYRLKAIYIKQEHNKLANKILLLGNEIYTETMNFKALQKRAKVTTINNKGKFNRKGRFGKSLNNKAPSMFLTILDRKLNYVCKKLNKVDTISFKASQYNHITDTFIKKELNERWNIINGHKVQRDLYSAFLLMNSKKNIKTTDKTLCDANYNDFLTLHDNLIETMKYDDVKYPVSFGIKKRTA